MNDINNVDLNLLKSLKALLAERHVGKAAYSMNVTQSAMSHTLARLRETFDDPLFVRTSKGLEPTARAIEVSGKLSFLLGEIGHLFTPKEFIPSGIQERFRLQTHDFISAAYLPSVFSTVRNKAPGITFDIQMITTSSYSQLDNGEIDLILGAGLRANPRFMQRRLCEEELVCLLDKDHPILKNWNTESLFRYPHIKLGVLEERDDPVSIYAKKHGLGPRKVGIYTQSLHMQPYVLIGTSFIAFVPRSVALLGEKLFGLAIKPSPFELPRLTIKAIWHERNQVDPAHQWIREKLVESFIPKLKDPPRA